jgi:antitoxin ParD1/3/4
MVINCHKLMFPVTIGAPMNVSLTPELEALVNDKVRSGLYHTASEVVREALRLLKQRDDEARRADQQAGLPAARPEDRPAPRRKGAGARRQRDGR